VSSQGQAVSRAILGIKIPKIGLSGTTLDNFYYNACHLPIIWHIFRHI
jgi:hypothetical protein